MSILSATQISKLCIGEKPLIAPHISVPISKLGEKNVCSFGQSGEGYDVRASDKFQTANKNFGNIFDIKDPDQKAFIDMKMEEDGSLVIPPQTLVLGRTFEYFHLPDDIAMVCFTKSRYARAGISLNTTKASPGWHGHLVLEFTNSMPFPVRIYPNEGVATMVFFSYSEATSSYSGNYQGIGNEALVSL